MKNKFLKLFCFFVLMTSAHTQALTQAFIQAGEVGQGFLLKRLNNCYLVSPAHVIGEEFFAHAQSNSDNRAVGEAQLLETFAYDLALLSLEGDAKNECSVDINSLAAIKTNFSAKTLANISTVNADGSTTLTPVYITDKSLQYLKVKPVDSNNELYKGQSGSLLFSQDKPVGMLLSINSKTKEGKVLRVDRIVAAIEPFFQAKPRLTTAHKNTILSDSNSIVLTPKYWSSAPLSTQTSISNLVDGTDAFWQAPFDGTIYELEFAVGDGISLKKIQALVLQAVPNTSPPKDIEILVNKKEKGRRGWSSVYSGTWIKNNPQLDIQFSGVKKAKRIKLKIFSTWDNKTLSIQEIKALL